MLEPGVNGAFYPEGIRDWDPVNHATMAEAFGRIGGVAWALFDYNGDRHILALETMDGTRTIIPIDTDRERGGVAELAQAIVTAFARSAS